MNPVPEALAQSLEETYRLERELGRGGMATVYLAEDIKHRRQVAVKVLHPELAAAIGGDRFVREIEIAAKLTHPHILMLIDSGEAGGHLFYVMPYVDGESLQDRLAREGALPLHESIRIMDHVASALSHAHALGVIHRDIKPANILLSGDHAIVADFGIARAVEAAGGAKLTGTGLALGTPAYMSPEQAFEQDKVDGRSDVYAMGCVLFEMLTGEPPFASPTAMSLFVKHASEKAPRLQSVDSSLPLFVDRAVGRALAKEPSQRFSSPRAFLDTLHSEAVTAPVERRRIAVLPPAIIGSDPDRQFLVLGLHEGLISQVGQGDLGDLDEGLKEYRTYFDLLGDEEVATALREDGSGPQAAMVRGAEVLVNRSKNTYVKPNNMVHLFSWGGDIDRAAEWFERSYEMRDHEVAYMGALATSEGLSKDPRFHEVLRRLDLPIPSLEA